MHSALLLLPLSLHPVSCLVLFHLSFSFSLHESLFMTNHMCAGYIVEVNVTESMVCVAYTFICWIFLFLTYFFNH